MNDDTFWMIKSNEISNENMSVGYTHDDNTFHNFYSNTDEFQFNEVSNQQSSQDYGVYQKSSQTPKIFYITKINKNDKENIIGTCHSKEDFDNILKKIKPMFHKFLHKFLQECTILEFGEANSPKLCKINGKVNKDIKIESNRKLLEMSLKCFFEHYPVSQKYKKQQTNKEFFKKIANCSDLVELFSKNYKDTFEFLFQKGDASFINQKYHPIYQKYNDFITKDLKHHYNRRRIQKCNNPNNEISPQYIRRVKQIIHQYIPYFKNGNISRRKKGKSNKKKFNIIK